ncbi:MAG TPA: hypothetical protein VLB27_06440, partial [candidate division Zixibacteria bacterium]|nr:hypothetical protein [candidate division Zixibacteria bacterium]
MRSLVVALGALCLTAGVTFAQSETVEKREELSKLRVELEQTEGELDSLRTVESELLKKLSGLDQRIALDRDVIKQITAKLEQLRQQRTDAEKLLQLRQASLQGAKTQFSDQMKAMYLNRYSRPPVTADPLSFVSAAPAPEFREVYFASLSEQTRREIAAAADSTKHAETRLKSVTSSAREAEQLKKKRTVSASIRETQRESSKR